MAKGAADQLAKASIAGMVLIRIFLGAFLLYSASAKIIAPMETIPPELPPVPLVQPATRAPAPVNSVASPTSPARPLPRPAPARHVVAPPPPAVNAPSMFSPEAFISMLRESTAPGSDAEHAGRFVRHNVNPDFALFLTGIVNPNADAFGWLVIVGEAGLGLLFLFGLLTRVAALLALVMNAGYLLATMHLSPTYISANTAFLVMELAVLMAGAGRMFGMDGMMGKKKSKSKD